MKFTIFAIFFLVISCASDLSKYGSVTPYNSTAQKAGLFIFKVNEEFIAAHKDLKKDKKHPKMTKAEAKLLRKLLVKQRFCVDQNDDVAFKITSRQERIYDVTFASLIEQNYNARAAVPRTYYGHCEVRK